MRNIDFYPIYKNHGDSFRWYFISQGSKDVVKVIEYSLISTVDGRPVYNLAFGDIQEDGIVNDRNRTNNGDVYKIFNTVLSTIGLFFSEVPNGFVFVSGSDSQDSFEIECRNNCHDRRCIYVCRSLHQRINAYIGFVRRNYDVLSKEYAFLGWPKGLWMDEINPYAFVPFQRSGDYQALLVSRV